MLFNNISKVLKVEYTFPAKTFFKLFKNVINKLSNFWAIHKLYLVF